MKRLVLLRHAKSAWNNPALADHDRPLNPRGRAAALAMARAVTELAPDLVLCSDAARTRETASLLVEAGAIDGLSIGFRTKLARRDAGGAKRRLVTIDLWEISLVTFPMQERARLTLLA